MFAAGTVSGTGLVRLRLCFDYPPPAASCRNCWLLVDLNTCRVVADVESLIREKFGFSRTTIVSLFIQDCYLLHTESVHVVRDEDCVRVKVDSLAQANGHSSSPQSTAGKHRKRKTAPEEEEEPIEDGMEVKKKKRTKCKESTRDWVKPVLDNDKNKRDKKKKERKLKKNHPPASMNPAVSPKTVFVSVNRTDRKEKKETSEKTTTKILTSCPSVPKPYVFKPPLSSQLDYSSSDDDQGAKSKPITSTDSSKPLQSPLVLQSSTSLKPEQFSRDRDSHSEEEEVIQLVNHWPLQPPKLLGLGRHCGTPGWGSGKKARRDKIRGFESSYNGAKQRSYETDSPSNASVALQHGAEQVPQLDYNSMPLLAAPPQRGQRIAFKLLELTENYTPEVSEYKEGKILTFDPTTNQIELELLTASKAPSEPGKFDLVYQNPDGSERVEYAVSRGSLVAEQWESLLEPRLII